MINCVKQQKHSGHIDRLVFRCSRDSKFPMEITLPEQPYGLQLLRAAINRLGRKTSCSGRPSVCDLQHLAVTGNTAPSDLRSAPRVQVAALGLGCVGVLDVLSQVAQTAGPHTRDTRNQRTERRSEEDSLRPPV